MGLPKLSDLPAEAQAMLKSMSPDALELLMCEIRGRQYDDRIGGHPSDPEGAARGTHKALCQPAALVVEDPLDLFAALFAVLREVLAKGASDSLDNIDCMHLWKMTDIADDLLRAHVGNVNDAKDRLRAFTHPPMQFRHQPVMPANE